MLLTPRRMEQVGRTDQSASTSHIKKIEGFQANFAKVLIKYMSNNGGKQSFCSIFKVLSQQRHHCHNVASRSAYKYINFTKGGNIDSVRVVS